MYGLENKSQYIIPSFSCEKLDKKLSELNDNSYSVTDDFASVTLDGDFEPLEIAPLSTPPELPDVMKPQDSSSSHAQEQVRLFIQRN